MNRSGKYGKKLCDPYGIQLTEQRRLAASAAINRFLSP